MRGSSFERPVSQDVKGEQGEVKRKIDHPFTLYSSLFPQF
jgi:hypothetical protein